MPWRILDSPSIMQILPLDRYDGPRWTHATCIAQVTVRDAASGRAGTWSRHDQAIDQRGNFRPERLPATPKWFSLRKKPRDANPFEGFSLNPAMRQVRLISLMLSLLALTGCASLASSATSRMADNLSSAMLNQDDPETVEAGMPSYLLLIDSLIDGDPQNENLLLAGSKLYGSYATAFTRDPERAKRLARKAREYADRALCARGAKLCNVLDRPFEEFAALIAGLGATEVPLLYASGSAWATWIQANSGDWNAIASLPKVKAAMARVAVLDETFDHGRAHLYLGVLATLLPPAMGGKPEEGRAHFDRAVVLAAGRDLLAKVEYARRYARIVYDRPLHDRLLKEVLEAEAPAPGLTLSNVLAKRQARDLLNSADAYF
jgi:hypothetical protein